MPVLKNPKHERFAQELAKGKSATDAMAVAGYSDPRNSTRLTKNDEIRHRVDELQGRAAERAAITIESLILEADEIQRAALAKEQYAPAVSALTAKAKLAGLWVEKRENTHRHVDPDSLTDAEIVALIQAGRSGEGHPEAPVDPSQLN